jgi:trans-2-enoyl-CoA reductase
LYAERLFSGKEADEKGRIRVDDWEMRLMFKKNS